MQLNDYKSGELTLPTIPVRKYPRKLERSLMGTIHWFEFIFIIQMEFVVSRCDYLLQLVKSFSI